ncbi:Hypothetical predicted protein [Olea europaea subsp. europaea]|uniref:Uncharacterized protein n=1 Tax=Olea europaea subsp. europaea TaxID=158383 RepID=A0A8S0SEN8_OLEEU|nr:Hypothetical predicted protein [Olea europaea subsp. europaea]
MSSDSWVSKDGKDKIDMIANRMSVVEGEVIARSELERKTVGFWATCLLGQPREIRSNEWVSAKFVSASSRIKFHSQGTLSLLEFSCADCAEERICARRTRCVLCRVRLVDSSPSSRTLFADYNLVEINGLFWYRDGDRNESYRDIWARLFNFVHCQTG